MNETRYYADDAGIYLGAFNYAVEGAHEVPPPARADQVWDFVNEEWRHVIQQDDYRLAIQAHVDTTAQERRYDGGVSLASYVASSNPTWAAEAQAFVAWRDTVWGYAYVELDRVLAGERVQPSVEAFIAELPAIEWPA